MQSGTGHRTAARAAATGAPLRNRPPPPLTQGLAAHHPTGRGPLDQAIARQGLACCGLRFGAIQQRRIQGLQAQANRRQGGGQPGQRLLLFLQRLLPLRLRLPALLLHAAAGAALARRRAAGRRAAGAALAAGGGCGCSCARLIWQLSQGNSVRHLVGCRGGSVGAGGGAG